MTKEAYYFSHDANARQDPKILEMMSVYGAEGYGWYWMLVEMMREQADYTLYMKGKYTFNALALQMHCKPDTSEQFVHDCINEFGLFESDDDCFWSNSLLRRMAMREEISQKRKKAAEARWGKKPDIPTFPKEDDAQSMQMHSTSNANGMQGKERKGKESNKEIVPYLEITNYLNEKAKTSYKPSAKKTQQHINARFQDGFTLDDFKKVIDIKTSEWLSDNEMSKYVRPETLFGAKFESYLNQKTLASNNASTQQTPKYKPFHLDLEE